MHQLSGPGGPTGFQLPLAPAGGVLLLLLLWRVVGVFTEPLRRKHLSKEGWERGKLAVEDRLQNLVKKMNGDCIL